MRSSARVQVFGYLGGDAEARFLQDGTMVLSFSVANSPYVKEGQPEHTDWYRCSLFGKRAEAVQPYLLKGTPVAVRGDLTVREYVAKDGQQRTSLDVRVNELDLLGSRGDREQQPAQAHAAKTAANDDLFPDDPF